MCFSARFSGVDPRSHWKNSLAAVGEASLKPPMHSKGRCELLSHSPDLSAASYLHVEVLLCLLNVSLDFWCDVKPQLFGHWQRNHGRSYQLRFLPA